MNAYRNIAFVLKDFNKDLKDNWKKLQFENDFCDMALACEGEIIRTHKVIISSISPVLKNILKNSQQNPFIFLTGMKYEDLINIVTLIYQGEVSVSEENLHFFLEVVENLEIKGFCRQNLDLSKSQTKFMKESYDSDKKSSIKTKKYAEPNDYLEKTNAPMINEELLVKTGSGKLKNNSDLLLNKTSDIEDSKQNIQYLTHDQKNIETSTKTDTFSIDYNSDFFLKTESENSATKTDVLSYKRSIVKKSRKLEQYYASLIISEDGLFLCKMCDKKYKDNYKVKRHIRYAHAKIYKCEQCDNSSPNLSMLQFHVESIHEGIRYNCDQCDYKAKTKGNLITHIKFMHEGANFPCDTCDYKTTSHTQIKRHRASIHKIGEELLCDQCDYRTRSKENLTAHVRVKHEGLRELCDKCNKWFTREDHLKRHIESVHYKVRFQCDQCGLKTTQKGDLTRHVKKVHKK